MTDQLIFKVMFLAGMAFTIGCSDRDSSIEKACQKLRIENCRGTDAGNFMIQVVYEKVEQYLEPHLEKDLQNLNSKLHSLTKGESVNELQSYKNIQDLMKEERKSGDKLEQVKIFGVDAPLFEEKEVNMLGRHVGQPVIKVRDAGVFSRRYEAIRTACDQFVSVECKINFRGRLDGVVVIESGVQRLIGWIDLEAVYVSPVSSADTKKFKNSVNVAVMNYVGRSIRSASGDLSWEEIYRTADKKLGISEKP